MDEEALEKVLDPDMEIPALQALLDPIPPSGCGHVWQRWRRGNQRNWTANPMAAPRLRHCWPARRPWTTSAEQLRRPWTPRPAGRPATHDGRHGPVDCAVMSRSALGPSRTLRSPATLEASPRRDLWGLWPGVPPLCPVATPLWESPALIPVEALDTASRRSASAGQRHDICASMPPLSSLFPRTGPRAPPGAARGRRSIGGIRYRLVACLPPRSPEAA
ncbi:hypothetical protein PAPYR_8029 [Paratrimastix pyriformis]|uniref:Uncharacterized protein n=1 Tax=Paratrimastix pyriformis TaxID=342808 RepID=A0ABQ8UBH0_9EUKA|nr:hypothetical protein PAPYR_8029 [Paratrimastix pyriformis]